MYLQLDSSNAKLVGPKGARQGVCAALTLPIEQTCPSSCELKKSKTCYAMFGPISWKGKKIEHASRSMSALQIACAAAGEMDEVRRGQLRGKPLRLFEQGDAPHRYAAAVIAQASRSWMARGGGPVWGYTHAWRTVPREAWSGVTVLASVEAKEGEPESVVYQRAHEAIARGYVPALVLRNFPRGDKAFVREGIRVIPCPAQTVPDTSCVTCGLCFDDDRLRRRGAAIGFEAHGVRASELKRRLPVMRDKPAASSRQPTARREARCFVPTAACGNLVWR